ncbi:MAG: hypothetical protein QOH31_1679 [Verrucomicrobiota bacterium]|jgi:hypothetical protein
MKRQLEGHLEAERHARDSLVLSLLVAVCIALLLIWKLAPEQTTKATVQSTPSPIPKATTQPTPAKTPDLKAVTPLVKPNDRIWRLKEDHFEELGSYALSYFWRNPPTISILRPDSTYEVLTCDDFYNSGNYFMRTSPPLPEGLKAVTPLVRPNDRIWRLKEDHFEELGSYALSNFWKNPPTISILRPDSTYEVLTCDDFFESGNYFMRTGSPTPQSHIKNSE